MSKNRQAICARKKHEKTLKRKNKTRAIYEKETVEERLGRRVRSALKNPHTRNYVERDLSELIAEAKERIKDLRFIHYYLIFSKMLCEKELIKKRLNYDAVKVTHQIKAINESIAVIPKLEEEVIQIELFDIGEKMSTLSVELNYFITLLSEHQTFISGIIFKMGERLPKKEDGTAYEHWEIENEVLRTVAIDYIAKNVYNMNTKKENDE